MTYDYRSPTGVLCYGKVEENSNFLVIYGDEEEEVFMGDPDIGSTWPKAIACKRFVLEVEEGHFDE